MLHLPSPRCRHRVRFFLTTLLPLVLTVVSFWMPGRLATAGPDPDGALQDLVKGMLAQKRYIEAEKILRESIRDRQAQDPDDETLVGRYETLTTALEAQDRLAAAVDALQQARRIAVSNFGSHSGRVAAIDRRLRALRERPAPRTGRRTASGPARLPYRGPTIVTAPGNATPRVPGGSEIVTIPINPAAGGAARVGRPGAGAGTAAAQQLIAGVAQAMQAGNWRQAQEMVDAALQADPENVDAMVFKADLAAKSNQLDVALEWSEKAVMRNPDHPAANFLFGSSLFVAQRYDEAARSLERVLALSPEYSAAYLPLGSTYVQLDRYEDALATFNQAKEAAPEDPKVRTLLGNLLVLMDRPREAVEELVFAAERDPDNPQTRFYLGLAQVNTGNRTDAEAQVRKLRQLNSELADQLAKHLGAN